MALSPPTRLDSDVYADAKHDAELMSRSTAQQISHWARIGREIEHSRASAAAIAAVLEGTAAYDGLPLAEQAVVRAAWDERMTELRRDLDLSHHFAASGQSYVELDGDGNVVRRNSDGTTTLLDSA